MASIYSITEHPRYHPVPDPDDTPPATPGAAALPVPTNHHGGISRRQIILGGGALAIAGSVALAGIVPAANDGGSYLLIQQTDDTMTPTIRRHDLVVIDTAADSFDGDGLYAYPGHPGGYIDNPSAGSPMIAHVDKMPGGGNRLRFTRDSFDPVYEVANDNEFLFAGKVVSVIRNDERLMANLLRSA